MKYLLGLLFNYKKYKKTARIRVFADDSLVDEIILEDDIGHTTLIKGSVDYCDKYLHNNDLYIPRNLAKTYQKISNEYLENLKIDPQNQPFYIVKSRHINGFLDRLNINRPYPPQFSLFTLFPNKLFIFELDGNFSKKQIKIECSNEDSNFSNGFMTKWSTIKFSSIFVLPTSLLEEESKMWQTFARLYKNGLFGYHKTWLSFDKCYTRDVWPLVPSPAIQVETSKPVQDVYQYSIGGNFTLRFNLFKKHSMMISTKEQRPKGRILLWWEIIEIIKHFKLLNICNEN